MALDFPTVCHLLQQRVQGGSLLRFIRVGTGFDGGGLKLETRAKKCSRVKGPGLNSNP